jgi:carboxyl-terminal processing protease
MKLIRRLLSFALSCLVQAWIVTACVAAAEPPALDDEQRRLNLESFELVWTTVRDRHFDPELGGLDWEAVREEFRPRVEAAKTKQDAQVAMHQMLERLGHSHVAILPGEILDALARPPQEGGELGVTGADLRVLDGHAVVTSVVPGSPANEAGLRPGWEIVRIGDEEIPPMLDAVGKEFEGKTFRELVLTEIVRARLIGPIGKSTAVRALDGDDQPHDLELGHAEERGVRSSVGHLVGQYVRIESRLFEPAVGYISLNKFMNPAAVMPPFEEAIRSFEETRGIVLDLRGNPGGIVAMGMGLAGWFVEEKNRYLGKLIMRETELKAIVFPRPGGYQGRLAILVDGLSGSTAEIFSGGMKDLGRARIFGTRTAGAALPSEIVKLPNGDGFQYVIADYISAAGGHLEGVGVIPDVEVQLTREALLQGRDPVLEAALSWIRGD